MNAADKMLNLLFLCTGNSCRSQMAEGWAKHLKKDQIKAFSAGTSLKAIDPIGVRVMAEVDISKQHSKHISAIKNVTFDYVVTVCDLVSESCPVFPGETKKVHRGFDDPPKLATLAKDEEEVLTIYRRIRDEIKTFIKTLPESLITE